MVGAGIVTTYIVIAVAGPLIAPYDPNLQNLAGRLAPPSTVHLLGADSLGRDILSRLLYGARLSMVAGAAIVSTALVVGVTLGLFAGYRRGRSDEIVMRITDMFLAFPGLILAMAIAAILRPSLTNAIIAIAATAWPTYARLMRGQVLSVSHADYVEAARAMGQTDVGIVLRHILPNAVTPIIVLATLEFGGAILTLAGLSFIGFGAQPPTPEWGVMVSQGRDYLQTQWWVPTAPAVAILFLVLGTNLLGDGLRDVFDPRLTR
jgi:peptide/nickel transport system permease protein